jgi:Lrp/AsnC family transcriptional regulator, regulator for asnA, asnC and gidA
MSDNFQIDSLDRQIIQIMMKDARKPFLDIARKCKVSGAAIHQRMQKLRQAGIITGTHLEMSSRALGYHTCAFIGLQINLSTSRTHQEVFEKIQRIPEIVECHHTTGKYSLFVKIYARGNEHLKQIITEQIQSILEVSNTETFISLEEGFSRQLPVD